jgi:hypothetical protein
MAELRRNLERRQLDQTGWVGKGGGGVVGEGGKGTTKAEAPRSGVGEAELECGGGLLCTGTRGSDHPRNKHHECGSMKPHPSILGPRISDAGLTPKS